jgi:hypothetical protein
VKARFFYFVTTFWNGFGYVEVTFIYQTKTLNHERLTLHHRRYPDYWMGTGRIRLFGNRINSRIACYSNYSIIVRRYP